MSSHDSPVPISLVLELSLCGFAKLFMFVWVQDIQVWILSLVQSCTVGFYPLSHFPAFPHRFRLLISSQGLTKLPELDFNSFYCATGLKAVSLLFQPLKRQCHQPWPNETTLKCRIQWLG